MKLTDYRIVLASNSPRRKELLSGIDVKYEFRMLPDIDESYPETISADEVAEYLAEKGWFGSITQKELRHTDSIAFVSSGVPRELISESGSLLEKALAELLKD